MTEAVERLKAVVTEHEAGLSLDAALATVYRLPKYPNRAALAADLRALLDLLSQEPVAWRWAWSEVPSMYFVTGGQDTADRARKRGVEVQPLYASPIPGGTHD